MTNTTNMLDIIKSNITFDSSTGKGTSPDAYELALPDNLTLDLVLEIQKYNQDFVIEATRAAGEIAVEAMANNPKLKEAIIDFQMGHDRGIAKVKRDHSFVNKLAPDGEKIAVPAKARFVITSESNNENSPEFKKMQEELSTMFKQKCK